jgi:hypothetical protein
MSSPTPAASSLRAPFQVHSIHFDFPGGQAIRLKEHGDNSIVGANPEWVASPSREELVAYVRASRPFIRVIFHGNPGANGTHVVGAGGAPCRVEEQPVALVFDPASGLSQPSDFRLQRPLPDQIGLHAARLDWYVRDRGDPAVCLPAGTSLHRVCTTWRPMTPNLAQGLLGWVYRQLMEWTCRWCAGQDDEKDICDAILTNLPTSGLQYGVPEYDVRRMLQQRGGMCGGWYQMFQQMAHCQGVFLHRRRFVVHWRAQPNGETLWCAIVIRSGGLNQPHPTHGPSEFHDNDTAFPIAAAVTLETRVERRYRFWGEPIIASPDWYGDGHCINFLEHRGRLYLYDACFGTGPFEIDSPLPPDDYSIWDGVQLSSLKARYLNMAVDYMLGSLYNGGVLCRTVPPGTGVAVTNGMTVRMACIPDMAQGNLGVTFYWGG